MLQYENEAIERGHSTLQMPPVKRAWAVGDTARSHVLSTDDIYMYEESDSTYIFTDITYGLPHRVCFSLFLYLAHLFPKIVIRRYLERSIQKKFFSNLHSFIINKDYFQEKSSICGNLLSQYM